MFMLSYLKKIVCISTENLQFLPSNAHNLAYSELVMYQYIFFAFLCINILGISVLAFSQGAPTESCESLQPRHELHTARPLEEFKYNFTASSKAYHWPRGIKVELDGTSIEGFIVAAYDSYSYQMIGHWAKFPGTDPLPCSAITHTNPYPKSHLTLLWFPPSYKTGNVTFLATVVKNYTTFYTGLVAVVPGP
ncbi:defense protein l(2)34Fc-like [Tachypleus tridentatus]|uniref:defense protein l(2)34Fc-like n=1 Tax=Tachypleus tridentatus TaxID=6853 RepID=UPI003FD3F05B